MLQGSGQTPHRLVSRSGRTGQPSSPGPSWQPATLPTHTSISYRCRHFMSDPSSLPPTLDGRTRRLSNHDRTSRRLTGRLPPAVETVSPLSGLRCDSAPLASGLRAPANEALRPKTE